MKRFLILLATLFCGLGNAQTINIDWKVGGDTYAQSTCEYGGDLIVPSQPTKYGYDFVGWNIRAAKELEYVYFQNEGYSYIDTGIKFDSDEIEYEIKFSTNPYYTAIFGAYGTCSGATKFSGSSGTIGGSAAATGIQFFVGNTIITTGLKPSPTISRLYIKKSTKNISATVNDSVFHGIIDGTITSNKNILLGKAGSGSHCDFSGSIYYFRIKKDGVLVLDFIPALDPDGIVCFWDNVSKTFFYKSDGTDLIAGPLKE